MANNTDKETMYSRAWQWILMSFLFLICLPASAPADEVNTIKSIRTAASGVEIELNSTRIFPVRDQIVMLRIGTKEFTKSRYPRDGNLNTLIFTLPTDEFEQINTGDQVIVQYGHSELNEDRWNFGLLDKSLLNN